MPVPPEPRRLDVPAAVPRGAPVPAARFDRYLAVTPDLGFARGGTER